jgi:membrane associated rhomboid family serine protease
VAVIGASGAILALYGYALAGNPLSGGLLARLDLGARGKLIVLAGVALAVTFLTAGPGVALVAHATGAVLGAVGGRFRVLRTH